VQIHCCNTNPNSNLEETTIDSFLPTCFYKMSNFGDNNLSFPSTTKQIMHLTYDTIESSPKIDSTQGNLIAQKSWRIQALS
jgi:hypothetical protein